MTRSQTIPVNVSLSEGGEFKPVQLMRAGTFRDGEINLKPEHFRSMLANFQRNVRRCEVDGKPALPVNYFHKRYDEAAGWMVGMELRNNDTEIWFTPHWTPKAAERIKNKEILYISAEFNEEYQDSETKQAHGATLVGAGLTNVPEIKGMPPIQLSEEDKMKKEDVIKFLAEADEDTRKELAAKFGGTPEDPKKLADKEDEIKRLAAEKEEAVKKLATEKDAMARKVTELSEELTETKKAVKDLTALNEAAQKAEKFDRLKLNGKACEAQREAYMAGDMVAFAEKAAPIPLSEKRRSSGGAGSPGDDGDKSAKLDAEAVKLQEKDKNLTYREAMSMARAEHPELCGE